MIIPSLEYERELWRQGMTRVVGVDEVGRGAWAGPVVAAAVELNPAILPFAESSLGQESLPQMLQDSKKLSPVQRDKVAQELTALPIKSAIGIVQVEEINSLGIGVANFLAMQRAIDSLANPPDFILIDGFAHPQYDPSIQRSIIKGDAKVASIAAASVLAKVYRDALMVGLDAMHPGYDFAQHKGYGTVNHQQAILKLGLSPQHRTEYKLKFLNDT